MPLEAARPRFSAIVWALVVMLVGFVTISAGYKYLQDWSALQRGLAACSIIWVATGIAMIVSGLWLFATLFSKVMPLRVGSWAVVITGLVLAVGTLANIVPCGST